MCTLPPLPPTSRWHDASPGTTPVHSVPGWTFRAQLLHLAAATTLPWRAVAITAGLDATAADSIVACRPRAGTIPVAHAAAVLALDARVLVARLQYTVDAGHARQQLAALLAAGQSLPHVAAFTRLSRPDVAALTAGHATRCSQRTELLLTTALQAAGVACPASAPTHHPGRGRRGLATRSHPVPAVA